MSHASRPFHVATHIIYPFDKIQICISFEQLIKQIPKQMYKLVRLIYINIKQMHVFGSDMMFQDGPSLLFSSLYICDLCVPNVCVCACK